MRSTASRRQKDRLRSHSTRILRLSLDATSGRPRWVTADLVDFSPGGAGVATAFPLPVGATISVNGRIIEEDRRRNATRTARVCWCLEKDDGSYRVGLAFDDEESQPKEDTWEARPVDSAAPEEPDYYEILQLSSGAHPDTVQRVYRLLAQRYHPDNTDTGDEEAFKQVLAAYRVLKDPESRSAYDARHTAARRVRWRVFESAAQSQGVEGEKKKRQSILSLLYAQRIQDAGRPSMTIQELEELLGCPRDHLQVTLWYLKEKGYIRRDDRGRYEVTVDGVDAVEAEPAGDAEQRPLLPAGT